jgi:WD40 repeat protein
MVGLPVSHRPAFSPDGRQFVVPTDDRLSVRGTRDLAEQRPALRLPVGGSDVVYLPDGTIVFAGDGMLGVLDPASGTIRRRVRVGDADRSPGLLAVQPGGSRIAVATGGRIALFDASATRRLGPPLEVSDVTALALSPDAQRVGVVRAPGPLSVWQFGRAHPVRPVIQADPILGRGIAYSPDGRLLATGDARGYLRLWDAQTLRPRGEPVLAHAQFVTDLAFSPDGAAVFTGGADGLAALWSVSDLRQIGDELPVRFGSVTGAITPDGRELVAVNEAGSGVVWPLDPAAWRRHACAVAGRRLTPREWRELLPAEPYRPACR